MLTMSHDSCDVFDHNLIIIWSVVHCHILTLMAVSTRLDLLWSVFDWSDWTPEVYVRCATGCSESSRGPAWPVFYGSPNWTCKQPCVKAQFKHIQLQLNGWSMLESAWNIWNLWHFASLLGPPLEHTFEPLCEALWQAPFLFIPLELEQVILNLVT